ncbi:MAG: hypothetical protein IT425_07310 [Pirellulales bacterium]|nr:hypothetical protein [Pirellulales bacterium]
MPSRGDVIVLANRTGHEVPLKFTPLTGQVQHVRLAIGENLPLYLDGKAEIAFSSAGRARQYVLDANCAYYFGRGSGGAIDLQKIGLGEDGTLAEGRTLPGTASRTPVKTISVKVLVDDEEPGRRLVWERRLRHRVEAASAVFGKYFRTRFEVVATDTWNSNNATTDFFETLAEFEREVKPAPAQLAIGFTSQWTMFRGRTHMAGTRGPMHPYILAREANPQVGEVERLEYLIHELGHFMGAAHSPEADSVMRPILGDKLAGRQNFRIQLDPVNSLAVAIISDEMRRRELSSVSELDVNTRKRLGQIYLELARALPDDPAAPRYAQLVRSEANSPVVVAAKHVLERIVGKAMENRALPTAKGNEPGTLVRRQGDELTEHLVREAARAAFEQPDQVQRQAFLLAIVACLGGGEPLANYPPTRNMLAALEDPSEQVVRRTVVGRPTLKARPDLLQHFLTSSLLAATVGIEPAYTAGIAKEMADAKTASGFSFADLAAGRAGARFALAVLNKKLRLEDIAESFSVSSYLPDLADLPEQLPAKEFAERYGTTSDPRFQREIEAIDRRILALPGYPPQKVAPH